jgi:hypothetical protein
MSEQEFLDLEDEFIVLAIPSRTVEVEIAAKIWHDGKVITVSRTMEFEEVRAAFEEAKEGYVPSNAVYVLNENYNRSKLERLLVKYCGEEEDSAD